MSITTSLNYEDKLQDSCAVKMLHQADLSVTWNQQPVCFNTLPVLLKCHNLRLYKNKTRRENFTKNKY